MDAAPFIDSSTSRTYVPVRFLSQALGANVNWDAQTQMVTLVDGSITEQMVVGSTTLAVNGQDQTMDTAPQIVPPGRTELPARFVAQAFGYQVTWNQSTQQVTITNQAQPVQPVGQIGSAPFAPKLSTLTVTVGSTSATGTINPTIPSKIEWGSDGPGQGPQPQPTTVQITLPVAPVQILPNTTDATWYMQHYPSVYNSSNTIINPAVTQGSGIYVPVAAIFEAFGVPPANVQWDGSRLTIYNDPSVSSYMIPNSTLVTSNNGGGTAHLQDPLLMIDGVPMMSENDSYGWMWNVYNNSLLSGTPNDSASGVDLYNGTVSFAYYPPIQ